MQPLGAGDNPVGLVSWVFPCPRQCRRVLLGAACSWPGDWPGLDLRGLVWPCFCVQQAIRDAFSISTCVWLPDRTESRFSPHSHFLAFGDSPLSPCHYLWQGKCQEAPGMVSFLGFRVGPFPVH